MDDGVKPFFASLAPPFGHDSARIRQMVEDIPNKLLWHVSPAAVSAIF